MSVKACCICNENNSKYRCPKCKQMYCSVSCCKKHKEQSCIAAVDFKVKTDDEIEDKQITYNFPTEDTVPVDKLESLRHNEEVQHCLQNPQVRDIITNILKNANPTEALSKAMAEPVFVELADACLKVVDPSDEEKPF